MFGHEQKFCSKKPRCVRYTGKHNFRNEANRKGSENMSILRKLLSKLMGLCCSQRLQKLRNKVMHKNNEGDKKSANYKKSQTCILPSDHTPVSFSHSNDKVDKLTSVGQLMYSQVLKQNTNCDLQSMLEKIIHKIDSQGKEKIKFQQVVLERLTHLKKITQDK